MDVQDVSGSQLRRGKRSILHELLLKRVSGSHTASGDRTPTDLWATPSRTASPWWVDSCFWYTVKMGLGGVFTHPG